MEKKKNHIFPPKLTRESSKLDKLINDYSFRGKKSLDWYTNNEKKRILFEIIKKLFQI